jgi:hypothetical protein
LLIKFWEESREKLFSGIIARVIGSIGQRFGSTECGRYWRIADAAAADEGDGHWRIPDAVAPDKSDGHWRIPNAAAADEVRCFRSR